MINTDTNERHVAYHAKVTGAPRRQVLDPADVPEEVRRRVSIAQIKLSSSYPFEAALLAPMKLHYVAADHKVIDTAATDCWRTIWLNVGFMSRLDTDDVMMVLAHEAHHALSLDGVRRGARNPVIWNYAGDLRINGILSQRKYSFKFAKHKLDLQQLCNELDSQAQGNPPSKFEGGMCLLDTEIGTSRTTESVYAELMSHIPNPPAGGEADIPDVGQAMGGDVRPEDAPGEGDGDGAQGAAPSQQEMRQEMQQRAARGALSEQMRAKQRGGHVDAFVRRFVDESLKDKVNWAVLLRRMMRKAVARDDYTMRRPARRALLRGIVAPSLRSEALKKVCIVSDTSGSVSNRELSMQAAEVAAIVRETRARTTEVAFVDTKVRNTQTFRRNEVVKFEPAGGGGTDFRPGVAWAEGHDPDVLVYFTDGYGKFPDHPPRFPVIWVLTGRRTIAQSDVPFGQAVVLD